MILLVYNKRIKLLLVVKKRTIPFIFGINPESISAGTNNNTIKFRLFLISCIIIV